jgi:hypothetical protein
MRCGCGRKRPPRRVSPSTAWLHLTSTPSLCALGAVGARVAKVAARPVKAREDRREVAGAVAEAEGALRSKGCPGAQPRLHLAPWAAQVLALRPAFCVARITGESSGGDRPESALAPRLTPAKRPILRADARPSEVRDLPVRTGSDLVGHPSLFPRSVDFPTTNQKRYRWLRYSERTCEVWYERPLPV